MMSMSIWKDSIILHWDGTLPDKCQYDKAMIAERPEILLPFWPLIMPYTKYSKKMGFFAMPLSLQNLKRVNDQFGKIHIREGYRHIENLRNARIAFKQAEKIAESIKSGSLEDIPYKMKPLGQYQHIGTSLLVHSQAVPLFADCGCLAGDTVIKYNRAGCSRSMTIEEMYLNQQKDRGNRSPNVKTKVRSFKEGHIGLHPIKKVVERGIKEVWWLLLEDGKRIKLTPDHEVLTKRGWVEMRKLELEDFVMVDNLKRHQGKKEKTKSLKLSDKRIAVGKYHPFARYQPCHEGKSGSYLVEVHRAVFEANLNGLSLGEFVQNTYSVRGSSMKFIDPKVYAVHHRNGDHYDNSVPNLEVITHKKHMQHHTLGYKNFGHGAPEYSRVVEIGPAGSEMTYDIVCEDPHRNFVANGMVVHNCGKTFMVLASTQEQFRRGLVRPGKVLVAGKLATLQTGWLRDCEKFTHMKAAILWLPSGAKRKEKLLEILNSDADIFITNHDTVRILEDELAEKRFEKVVIDESSILKGFKGEDPRFKGGQFGKSIIKVAKDAKYRVIMSGTPASNGPQDLWGQMLFLDPYGFMLERTIHNFNNYFMQEVFFGDPKNPNTPKKWVPGPKADEIPGIIAPLTYRVRIRDHILDLPEETDVVRTAPMTKEQVKHYEEMKESLWTMIEGNDIDVDSKLTQIMKLRQITGGFLIDHNKIAHAIEDTPKLKLLDDLLLDEIPSDEKVVIFAEYQWEIETISERYKDQGVVTVYGGNNTPTNLENIRRFIDDPSIRISVLHPASAAHGITFTCAHYMVFYSYSYSAEWNYQARARIKRAGQKNAMFFYYLACTAPDEESIDVIILRAIDVKNRNQAALIDGGTIDQTVVSNNILQQFSAGVRKHGNNKKRKG